MFQTLASQTVSSPVRPSAQIAHWQDEYPAELTPAGRHQLAQQVVASVPPAMKHVISEYRKANRELLAMWEQGVEHNTLEWQIKSAEATAVGGWLPEDIRLVVIYGFAVEYQDFF
jgi:hypothetical protein